MTTRSFDILLYGATGYSGRLIAKELDGRKASFALAGRSVGKLEELSRGLSTKPPVFAASTDDAKGLVDAASRARVVLSCAGPFMHHGMPVQDAALAAGAHFLDITGEHPYMTATARRDALARSRNVALVNAVGFDVIPSDIVAVLAARAVKNVTSIKLAFIGGGRLSQGTMRSGLAFLEQGGSALVGGTVVKEPLAHDRWRAPFPPPVGPRNTISAPLADIATAGRSTGASTVRVYISVPGRVANLPESIFSMATVVGLGPVKRALEELIERAPEGASEEERSRQKLMFLAEATGANDSRALRYVSTRDAYGFTAVAASTCAMMAAADSFQKTGALTPTQAFGADELLSALSGWLQVGEVTSG